jgi:methyltransferase (TIGR00027 family)
MRKFFAQIGWNTNEFGTTKPGVNTTGPSTTAAVVASTLLLLNNDPELARLGAPEATPAVEAAVRRAIPLFGTLLDRVPWPMLERAAHVAERLVSPGFVAHYALRKFAVRQALLAAVVERGHRQVVLVGAGFDMMALSLPADCTVIEADHPATQSLRRDASEPPEITFVPVDLTVDRLEDALRRSPKFDPNADTVFVAEGLLMYLEPERVDALLADLAKGPGARTVVLSIVTPDHAGRVRIHSQRRVVDWIMRWIDEPFVWGESPEKLRRTLDRHGFVVETVTTTTNLRDDMLSPTARRRLPTPPGEIIVVATKARA